MYFGRMQKEELTALTIEEFKEFCEREKYLEYKGRANAGNYTIDRRNDKLGYTKDNIFVLTLSKTHGSDGLI